MNIRPNEFQQTGPVIRPHRCENCKFRFEAGQNNFQCRRNPPHPQIFLQTDEKGRMVKNTVLSAWPPVANEQWCGEHKPYLPGLNS